MKKGYKGLIAVLGIIFIFCVGTVGIMVFKPLSIGDTNHISDSKSGKIKPKKVSKTVELTDRQPLKYDLKQKPLTKKEKVIEKKISLELKQNHFIGTVLIASNNNIIYQHGYGYANYKLKAVNTSKSQYQILSIQKMVTAQMVMKLVQDHKIKLSDSLSKYYPQISNSKNIKISNLLNMTSGLKLANQIPRPMSPQDIVDWKIQHLVNDGELGRWSYQEVNYNILAGILMKVTNRTYYQLYNTYIQNLFKFKGSGFVFAPDAIPYFSTNYTQGESKKVFPDYSMPINEKSANQFGELGTGNLVMSAGDLYKLTSGVLQNRVVSAKTNHELADLATGSQYAGGMYHRGDYITGHGRGYGGEVASVVSNDGKQAVIMMSNFSNDKMKLKIETMNLYNRLINGEFK
ncbi:serine hydrolase domain-containing protein [Pediococcus argentinicus]|uniref:Beta-lactamase-related domain-containing protein n=1 Tax=Pediococcus argentinicus TaxID=480391 RepID=A0A0R2NCZ2_9LACO|nr:serine hydrolase [Pediococcus argentinicus]KRO23759.1 hypothetical protein IV88_GL000872 [Pediococcus argentinicus]NKZ22826.1 serine hydrolase [Pediococcus argentinicus]GEP19894.1 peptidase S12 [Pediococcus argentinicus]